ncbi:type-2 ice-structuring protein-like [Mastacembelus armatus]|uniref:type-2 ice-structuring protein-like n=1 Tax=Mastacembelus armatus TaxID=205130 RepID=UPI000E4661DE|nr:type-2 ice-structuring protein-like [Mastacembelus armatus]
MKTLILAALLCALLALDTAQGQSCPSGWALNNGRCFTYVPRYMSWNDAQVNCRNKNANLASVRDKDDYAVIQKVIADGKWTRTVWIGGQKGGSWFWIDGTPFRYTNWAPGQPDYEWGNEFCIQVNYGAQKLWGDEYCGSLMHFVCSKNV